MKAAALTAGARGDSRPCRPHRRARGVTTSTATACVVWLGPGKPGLQVRFAAIAYNIRPSFGILLPAST